MASASPLNADLSNIRHLEDAGAAAMENSEQVLKYLLAGADVVMTTSALLRNGPHYVKELLAGTVSWLSARELE